MVFTFAGKIRFNEGNRTSLKLDLLKLRQDRLVKVGEWTSQKRLSIINHGAFHDFGTTNITLRVTTIEVSWFVAQLAHWLGSYLARKFIHR